MEVWIIGDDFVSFESQWAEELPDARSRTNWNKKNGTDCHWRSEFRGDFFPSFQWNQLELAVLIIDWFQRAEMPVHNRRSDSSMMLRLDVLLFGNNQANSTPYYCLDEPVNMNNEHVANMSSNCQMNVVRFVGFWIEIGRVVFGFF